MFNIDFPALKKCFTAKKGAQRSDVKSTTTNSQKDGALSLGNMEVAGSNSGIALGSILRRASDKALIFIPAMKQTLP